MTHRKLETIKLLLLDVDGVMTDGRIIYDAYGVETKFFNVKDGHGIKMLDRFGIKTAIITGRSSIVVDLRARELGIDLVYQGALRKLESYEDIKMKTGLSDSEIAFMGDDLIDIPVLKRVAFSAAPADAVPEVISLVDFVSVNCGGRGAVRELCNLILEGRGFWDEAVKRYEL